MKQVITAVAVALAVVLLNMSLAANSKGVDKKEFVPEVIKCEGTDSCEMTEIEKLPKSEPKKEKKAADKSDKK
jgi:hypothetical protein